MGYPPGPLVQQYIHAYADHFGLKEHIRLKTPLQKVERNSRSGSWTLTTAAGASAEFDFVVSAVGVYNAPFVPEARGGSASWLMRRLRFHYKRLAPAPQHEAQRDDASAPPSPRTRPARTQTAGAASFKGAQVPAPEFTSAEAARGRDVVVVGAGKSALDIAAAAAMWGAKSVTVLQRRVHWPLAPFIGGIIPYEFAAYSRLAAFSPAYYSTGLLGRALHAIFVRRPAAPPPHPPAPGRLFRPRFLRVIAAGRTGN